METTYYIPSPVPRRQEFRGFRAEMCVSTLSLFDYSYVYGLLALGAVADFEFDLLALVERFETIRYDAREMNENLLAVLPRNESVAFFAIEPFYLTFHKKEVIKMLLVPQSNGKIVGFQNFLACFFLFMINFWHLHAILYQEFFKAPLLGGSHPKPPPRRGSGGGSNL